MDKKQAVFFLKKCGTTLFVYLHLQQKFLGGVDVFT